MSDDEREIDNDLDSEVLSQIIVRANSATDWFLLERG